MDWSNWSISHEKPVELTCSGCNGRGYILDGYECECGGTGTDWFDLSALTTLAHNLAIAAALCSTWVRGFNSGFDHGWEDYRRFGGAKPSPVDDDWRPGCNLTHPARRDGR